MANTLVLGIRGAGIGSDGCYQGGRRGLWGLDIGVDSLGGMVGMASRDGVAVCALGFLRKVIWVHVQIDRT